jgi:hypothetical protein
MMNEQEQLLELSNSAPAKRRYQPPMLSVFGPVALLTQSAAGSCRDDGNNACTGGVNMSAMASARILKENIARIGTHPLGIGLYLFDYKPEYRERWGHGKQLGVMADEVETLLPEAVSVHPDGYQMVNYAMLAEASRSIH